MDYVEAGTGWAGAVVRSPIDYDGEDVLLNPPYMMPGLPYHFVFLDHRWVATKNADGTIDFYYLPKPGETP